MAKEIFEEALDARMSPLGVKTARDFGIVFNSFVKFLHQLYRMDRDEETLAELQALLARRPYLLQETVLVTCPNDVKQWLKLVELSERDFPELLADAYTRALEEIDADKCQGRYSDIWIKFAEFNCEQSSLVDADIVF